MDQKRSLAPAVTRASAILDVLAEQRGRRMGISELARRLGVAKSSVSNICNALVDSGLLRQTPEGFGLGQRLVSHAEAYLASVDIVDEFQDVCRSATLDETVQLAVLDDLRLEVVYLARRDGRQPVVLVSQIGRSLPATTTATGKAMLAALPADELRGQLERNAPLPQLTPKSITDPVDLERELAAVREQGHAVDDGETAEGLLCIAMAVPGPSPRRPAAAVSLTGLAARYSHRSQDEAIEQLRALTDELGTRIGGRPPDP
ncbi:IclR family transcriptional regulator [Nocardiopsis salina]|uniref:IclR family transcriptional regulator n=1 Tax=Nocardiopsis salina TaxID=245836 RepID=UPI000345A66C|nr:IclR family transcriptional regulator [Nocardiopsis salina]